MTIAEIEKMLEEAIEYWNNKDKHRVDFLKCLLEISRNNNINGHKYVYAYIESFEEDELRQPFAVVRICLK